jgi:hypothetical protein
MPRQRRWRARASIDLANQWESSFVHAYLSKFEKLATANAEEGERAYLGAPEACPNGESPNATTVPMCQLLHALRGFENLRI